MPIARVLCALLVLLCLVVPRPWAHAATERSAKIDPALHDARYRGLGPGQIPYLLEGRDGRIPARVRTLDPTALRREAPRQGILIRAIVGNIASVEVPDAALAALAALPGVLSIKPAPVYSPVNDVSTAEVGADAVASTYGGTGRGVIVAVIDSGLDFRHLDFRNADGTTRVLAAWDQTDALSAGAGCGPGVTFGRCWTRADLNADLAGGPVAGLFDGYAHGTHVAGIAAGNGRGTANGVPSGTYAGVAPEADLLIVKVFNSQGVWTNGDLPAAFAWIRDQAAAAGEPFVINMSLAGDVGPHDGTSPDEQALDALLADGVQGRAAAVAAGNARDKRLHTSGTVAAGVTTLHPFQIPAYTPATGPNNDSIQFNLWYEGTDNLTVSLLDPNNLVLATATRGTSAFVCSAYGGILIDALNDSDPDNLDSEVRVRISDVGSCVPATPPPSNRTMTLRVAGVSGAGAYHVWVDGGKLGSGAQTRFVQADATTTVGIPATSQRTTSVGGYWTRHCFPNADPNTGTTCVTCPPPFGGQSCPALGALADESSAGPTRDGRLKPELVAPYAVLSSLSASATPPPPQFLSPDARHFAQAGTSLAAPHVAGALAVLLQFNSHLDAVQARQMLIDGARTDQYTGLLPNPLYGNGKLGVAGGAQSVLKLVEDLVATLGGDFLWASETHSTGYNVYRANLPMPVPPDYGPCLESGLALSGFSDPEVPSEGTGFLYLVTGVKDGIEGSLGFDSALVQRSNSIPCP